MPSPPSFSSCTAVFLLILCANFCHQVENKSVFGIGTRIIGDQLLMKDVLQSPPISLTEEPVIKFNYAIAEPITFIEIVSEKNVHAAVKFSYENDLVEGTVSLVNGQQQNRKFISKPKPFEVVIRIYGLNDTMLNVNPAYILNKDGQFNGVLEPHNHEALSLIEEDMNAFENSEDDYDDANADEETDNLGYDDEDGDYDDGFDDNNDKIIEQGQRQEGDILVYEIYQTSANTTKELTNHSIILYYIDIYYITYVKITLFEHFKYNNRNGNYIPPIVEYGHISPTTLKAVVTDYHTTSLFVQMQLYGFHPNALPVDYKPFLSTGQTAPISSLSKLKLLMNAQHPHQQQSSQQHQNTAQEVTQQQQPTNELGQQQLQTSQSNENSNVNCWQQAVSANNGGGPGAGGSSSHVFGTYGYLAIFNLIATMAVTMIFRQNPIY